MADIKLGLSGSEITLPQIQARGGTPPGMPVSRVKQMDRWTMADGATRFNTRAYHPRTFPLAWEQLTAAEYAPIETEANRNVRLRFQNNWFSADYIWVRVASFKVNPVVYLGTMLFSVQLELEEEL